MIIREIDFQDYDVSERDGEETGLKRINGSVKLDWSNSKVINLATGVEDFAEPEYEPSVFDALSEKAYSLEGDALRDFVAKAVLMMVMVLKLQRTVNSETWCRAWILDTLDERVDFNTTDPYNDRWFDHLLYPRLSRLAKQNHGTFRTFRSAISMFVSLPDLSSQNPTIDRKRPS